MGQQKVLSSKFNMSLGFVPVIISMLLCEIVTQDISIYIGAGVGTSSWLYSWRRKEARIPQAILFSTTGVLLLLSVVALFTANYCPSQTFPFVLEASVLIPPFIIYLNRKRFLDYHTAQTGQCCKQLFAQSAEAAIVSARVVLLVSLLHFLAILATFLISPSPESTARYILFHIAPVAVFVFSIAFNQLGIAYFNSLMRHTVFVPVVNKRGDVIGKVIASDAINRKNDYINPVIRIAVTVHGMLYLRPRPQCSTFDQGKTDLPIEGYLLYGESLEQGATRMLKQTLPTASPEHLYFNLKYHFENKKSNRLVYLFTLDLDDDLPLCHPSLEEGKLWTLRQIEHNLGKGFFSRGFEQEYEPLKSIIYTREKYRES